MCVLMRNNIDTVFLTRTGRYLGRLTPVESKNVFLRKKQFGLLDDPAFGARVARSVVAGKMANMATMLMRIKRERDKPEARELSKKIRELIPKVEACGELAGIRGYEGMASAHYFKGLREGFVESFGFVKRVRRPPTDPVNSVLSLLYTFLMNRVYSGVRVAGLDPYPGCLHSLDYGRYSLVLDLMEEFRTIVADTLTLSLFNLKILGQRDFRIEKPLLGTGQGGDKAKTPDVTADPIGRMSGGEDEGECFDVPEQRMEESGEASSAGDGKYPVKLESDAFRRVLESFEKKLTTRFFYPLADKQMTYGEAIVFQANHFRKVVEGEAEIYQPLLLK